LVLGRYAIPFLAHTLCILGSFRLTESYARHVMQRRLFGITRPSSTIPLLMESTPADNRCHWASAGSSYAAFPFFFVLVLMISVNTSPAASSHSVPIFFSFFFSLQIVIAYGTPPAYASQVDSPNHPSLCSAGFRQNLRLRVPGGDWHSRIASRTFVVLRNVLFVQRCSIVMSEMLPPRFTRPFLTLSLPDGVEYLQFHSPQEDHIHPCESNIYGTVQIQVRTNL
jgi:uncharacterized MAPEG superfamily protein